MKKNRILKLYQTKNTVFSLQDIALLWQETNYANLKALLHYYVKKQLLFSPRHGLYALDKNYNPLELATKIYTPAYVSLETVLQKLGVVFQHYESIFCISYLTREIECDKQHIIFKKIKKNILTNLAGIEKKQGYFIASKERALLDRLYLNQSYHFDNLKNINWPYCLELAQIYEKPSLIKKVKELKKYAGYK